MSISLPKRKNNSELTRKKILDAAVKHFGAHGYQGASLRNIIAEAGVNLGAANYHFGSKKNVYFSVCERFFRKTHDVRLERMTVASNLPAGREQLRALIRAYIGPHLELVIGNGEHDYGRLIIQMMNDDQLISEELFALEINKVRIRFLEYLRECCPGVDDDVLSRGIGLIVAIMAQISFDPSYRTLTKKSQLEQPVEEIIDLAVAFSFGGLVELFEMNET